MMKKSAARFLCVILAIALLLTALPITVYAEGGTVINVSTAEELATACSTINTNGGTYTIELKADFPSSQITIDKSDAVVTIIGNGHYIANNGAAVSVEKGATAILGDGNSALTLQG